MDARRDRAYLREQQYATSANLSARIAVHERYSTATRGWHEWIFDTMALPAGARVLEVGTGAGTLWVNNETRLPAIDVVLSDLSAGMLADARAALSSSAVALTPSWLVADAQALPVADASFDVAIANAMLYHVPDLASAVRELRRVVRPGGSLFASTFGADHLRELDSLLDRHGAPHVRATADTFGLDNGVDALGGSFSSVEVRHYDDGLLITEPEPLHSFLDSMIGIDALDDAARAALHEEATHLANAPGGWSVTKAGGLLIAQ